MSKGNDRRKELMKAKGNVKDVNEIAESEKMERSQARIIL